MLGAALFVWHSLAKVTSVMDRGHAPAEEEIRKDEEWPGPSVVVGEVHRANTKRGGFSAGRTQEEPDMPIHCDVVLEWSATPEQLKTLGAAFWRWRTRTAGDAGIYQLLDDQTLADLIAGRFPALSQAPGQRGVHFSVRDEGSQDRQATIDSLRREIPAEGIAAIVVGGRDWGRTE
jgi:hypothetical protein